MGAYRSDESEKERFAQYQRARLGLLELIIFYDKLLYDGPRKETILNGLVDAGDDIIYVYARGDYAPATHQPAATRSICGRTLGKAVREPNRGGNGCVSDSYPGSSPQNGTSVQTKG